MASAARVLDRKRCLLEAGLRESVGPRTTSRLLDYMEDWFGKRTEALATKEDLLLVEQKLSGQMSTLEKDLTGQMHALDKDVTGRMASLEQKLSAEVSSLKEMMHANTWKILSGMVAIFGIFRFVDMLLGK